MPRGVGRPEKEGKKPRVKNPRGAPRKTKALNPFENDCRTVKQEVKVENHAKFGAEAPCKIVLHWVDDKDSTEINCKSYSVSHGICYLTTKLGEDLVPLPQLRRIQVTRL